MRAALLFFLSVAGGGHAGEAPRTVAETWASFDPRAEPLAVEAIGQWDEGGIDFRHVRYVVGTFEGHKARVAAFYGFPSGGRDLPAIVQVHGGGQRAETETVKYWASHGYAAIAVNWGEKAIGEDVDLVTSLTLTPGDKERPEEVASVWQGRIPTFKDLRWEGGEFAPRPPPYLDEGHADARAARPLQSAQ